MYKAHIFAAIFWLLVSVIWSAYLPTHFIDAEAATIFVLAAGIVFLVYRSRRDAPWVQTIADIYLVLFVYLITASGTDFGNLQYLEFILPVMFLGFVYFYPGTRRAVQSQLRWMVRVVRGDKSPD